MRTRWPPQPRAGTITILKHDDPEDPVLSAARVVGVLIVDDQGASRGAMRSVVEAAPGFACLAEADCGESAVASASALAPDLVLMDVEMPGSGGIAATRTIKTSRPSTFVVLVSATHPDDLPAAAATCGDRVVWKPHLRPRLLEEIWRGRGGEAAGA